MIINIAIAAGVVAAIATTFVIASPAGPRTTARGLKRRERQLRRVPARATAADVQVLLRRELPADVSAEVCRLAAERELSPAMLWCWAESHSATLLALALSAGFNRRELALTRPRETELDQESLEMHAELCGSLVGSMVVRAVHRPVSPAMPAGRACSDRDA